ncbi:MAG TPA: ABC transporter substrate-binding protein [Dehalococcoidia bacterium]|nr:ABC transporter substrate-binding protein [Dehalococcoidia bacterium]
MKSKKLLISLGLAVVLVVAFALPACEPGVTVKRLTVGTLVDVPNLNMDEEELENSNLGCIYKNMVYETLTAYPKVGDKVAGEPDLWYDADGFIPTLATGYNVTYESRYHPVNKVMQDAQVWTVTLREGVKWHDFATSGEYLDADDVEFTCKNVLSEWDPAKPICWEDYWEEYEATWWVNATGTHTIEFIFEHNITEAHHPMVWAWDAIVPEHVFGPDGEGVYDDWDPDPMAWDGENIGTGPYKFVEYKPGQYHKWVRNDDWWGESEYGPIEIEEIYIKIFPTMESLVAAFEEGEIDTYMASFAFASIPSFLEEEDITVEVVPGVALYYLGFNLYTDDYWDDYGLPPALNYTENPLHDKALRQAIAFAIDAQPMVDVILGGDTNLDLVPHGDLDAYGDLADSWVYPESAGYKSGMEMYEQDIDKAAELMVAAGYYQDGMGGGYEDGGYWVSNYTDEKFSFELRTANTLTEGDTGQKIHDDLEAFGIDINFLTVDSTTFLQKLYQPYSNEWDLVVGEEEPAADPVGTWALMLITDPWGWGEEWSPTFWVNVDFNEKYEEIYSAADPNIPRREAQAIANEELPMYMLYREHTISAYWTDRWTGWYNELGGPLYWFNEWNMYGLHWVGGD